MIGERSHLLESHAARRNQWVAELSRQPISKMENTNRIIAATIVLVITVGVVAITVSRYNSIWCGLVNQKPEVDVSSVGNFASSDLRALVKFAGFISYEIDSTYRFVPLRLDSVSINTTDQGKHLLVVLADCARLSFAVEQQAQGHGDTDTTTIIEVKSVHVDLALTNRNVRICDIHQPGINFTNGQHYACLREHSMSCHFQTADGSQTKLAELVFEAFEFEIDGDPAKIELRQFSSPKSWCPELNLTAKSLDME